MVGITGIGSGIDINSIVSAMVSAEKAPKEAQLARLEKASTTKFSALGQLKGALSEFQTAMKDLNSLTLFEKRSATSSNTGALTASASKTALAGSYQMTVERLASSSKVATAALASDFAASADGKLTVKLGAADAGVEVDIAAGDTLVQIRDKLNTALKDKGITANVINNPADGKSRLVLNAKETGTGKDISIETADAGLTSLALDGSIQSAGDGAGYLQQAADAEFTIDGLALKSPSNTVSGAIPEVTLTLAGKTEADKPLTLTVDQDKTGVTANIKKFVEAYNKLISTANQLTSVTPVGEGKAPVTGGLVGDATVRTLLGAVRNELVNPAEQEGVRVLADLGITTQKDGTLKIDDTKLGKALSDNFDAVGTFFTGDTGLMSRVDKRIDGYIQTGGVLEQRMKGLQTTITGIDKQKEDLTRRVAQMQARLFAQFNAMDALVGRLNDTSARLTQALGSLPGVVKQDG
ncbi:flagellar filament capping protein FliD [Pseudomonas lalucatii]|uniref:Flagellar hook-associated protein 2 n=1 Tax=Pseudomonas lalucatii TaxID=1424203 RepID=A0ABS5Q4L5_9PSED|nr:flagellar filament capping protein FliD [Pseudomonas lalucatii]MBS7663074.1 flagellar filament capping protein FliD [Pseudomonas lalucatii]MBS7724813.1 flagellar filament capping protein FliD [Pseudomonas lalucatii]QVM87211.1 flagellar filament capping protein FliD [Pseudomonas lalucatii]